MNHASLELFLAACGSDEPLRIGVGQRDELGSEIWSFQQPFLVIGRRPESDLMLDHWQVSRRHAYLQLIEGRYYCVDLGSRTGTHGGDSTERSGWLEPGRAIQIGPFAVRPEWPASAARGSSPVPGVTWELPTQAIGQSLWRMDRHLALVGRSPACKIRIVQPDVSKFHCSIVLTRHGAWVVDLLGQNGVRVNDEAVRCARIEDGDEVRVGRHALRARYDSAPLPLPEPRAGALAIAEPSDSTARLEPPSLAGLMPMMPQRPPVGQGLSTLLETSGGAIDPSVNLLVHQFGMMQQQMFDQFHHSMMMMFEGFAALHREQTASIREEFAEVRRLSDEIEALRLETARLAKQAAKNAERPAPAPSTNGHSRPIPPGSPRPNFPSIDPPRPAETFQRATPPPPDPDVDIHAQLCLRLSTIQSERQNRWQKILGMMSAKS